jgi:hypothetical protein
MDHKKNKLSEENKDGPMNFIAICLHSLDMRDFHSYMRNTPFLDELREKSIFITNGKGQGHHAKDSLNAEITGVWTARFADGTLSEKGYSNKLGVCKGLPKTVIEYLKENGYDIFTCVGIDSKNKLGSYAASTHSPSDFMRSFWLANEPERQKQFNCPGKMTMDEWLNKIKNSDKFYAHIFLRGTHRPWSQPKELLTLAGKEKDFFKNGEEKYSWFMSLLKKLTKKDSRKYCELDLISAARRLAVEKPSEFAELRRRGLEKSDEDIRKIFEETKHLKNVTYIVYSNHGEMFDHFRYHLPLQIRNTPIRGVTFVEGTSHSALPYEALYNNMQMWLIPGKKSKLMRGVGRSIDITPTILDLAKITPKMMDGESMINQFDEGFFPDRDRYAEVPQYCISMVRADGYKFISIRGFPSQHILAVFDLKNDPDEYLNIINTPQGQEVVKWAVKKHKELKG